MTNMKPARFEDFLAKKVANGQLAPELLPELVGKESANRILDNSMNAQGAPAIGGGHIAVQHGAISEIAGQIPDAKSSLNMAKELVDELNLEAFNMQNDNLEFELQKQPNVENNDEDEMSDEHLSKPR